MKILSYLNISNIDDIESDSGYIFNYILGNEFCKNNIEFSLVLPNKIKNSISRNHIFQCYYVNMGCTKYESRYLFNWSDICDIVSEYNPDVILLNQSELTASFRVLLNENSMRHTKIFTYCHYPALHINDEGESLVDYTLNYDHVGDNIVYNILTAINISNAFAIQSEFARSMLLNFAKKHNFNLNKEIVIVRPPYDEVFYSKDIKINKNINVLYNHRLYDSYGTSLFIDFVRLNNEMNFIVTDPMSNRCKERSKHNNSPKRNRDILNELSNVNLIDGSNRQEYKKAIDCCRFGIAPYRTACVWSMSIVDCFCRGIPVIGPNIAAFHEIIPDFLLYHNEQQQQELAKRLINDDEYWIKSTLECRKILEKLSPYKTMKEIITVI